jgi:anti-sigma factor RsiW
MTRPNPLGDLEIGTFTDGELDDEAARAVQSMLAGDDEGWATVAWHQALRRRLHQAYDGILAEKAPDRTMRLLQPRTKVALPVGLRRFAALAAVLAIAASGGYLAGQQRLAGDGSEAGLARIALGAHQIYASDVIHPVEMTGDDTPGLAKWLGKRLGISFSVPVISETGFKLVGGRLLAEGDKPAGLLLFEDAAGRRISLFIEKWPEAGETSMRFTSSNGLNAYYWVDSPLACAVSGNISSDELKGVAERIYAALEKA